MKKKGILSIGILILISISSFIYIYAINQNIIPVINTVGYGIEVEDDFAYVSHNDGVEIINIENKNRPLVLGNIDISDGAFGIEKNGDILYIAGDSNGLVIANISNPQQPVICSETTFGSSIINIAVQNEVVYLGFMSDLVEVFNVTDPSSPVHISTYTGNAMSNFRGLIVSGDLLYIADSNRGIEIVNISIPSSPTFIRRIDTSFPIGLFKQGNILFAACHAMGVYWYDITNGTEPLLKGSYHEIGGEAYGVWGNSTHLYVADLQKGIFCIDITDEGGASKVSQNFEVTPHSISGWENHVFLADQNFRFMILDLDLNFLYDGHKLGYGLPIIIVIVTIAGIIFLRVYQTKESQKKKSKILEV
jgi:hypothetical protein